jgi:2-methylisocitrate lyase-like PEP mutase family enzyme
MAMDQIFRTQHEGGDILLLPNAWDAGSARLMESRGAKAVATTSAGLAWSRGYPDGDALPVEKLVAATRDIARVLKVPLTVDIEGGYSSDPQAVGKVVAAVIEAGAVGINIEDGNSSPDLLRTKIEAARSAAGRSGVSLFINTRTDVYLRKLATGDAAVSEVLRRAKIYREAGCDGIFVPGIGDLNAMKTIAAAIAPAPLNVMLIPGLPRASVLQAHGVRRLSSGTAIAQAALGRTSQLTDEFLSGEIREMFSAAADYAAINRMFAGG